MHLNRSENDLLMDMIVLEELIDRYGGESRLWEVHDKVCVDIDFKRGTGSAPDRNDQPSLLFY